VGFGLSFPLSPLFKNKTLPFVSYLFPSSGETTNSDKQLKNLHIFTNHTREQNPIHVSIFSTLVLYFFGLAYVESIFLGVRVVPGVSFVMVCLLDLWSNFFLMINPLNPELNPICYLLALLGAHHFLHVSRIRVKSLTLRRLMSYIYGAPILDVSRSHTTTQHSR